MNTLDYFACKDVFHKMDLKYPNVFFIGGSVCVNPNTANDFDLIMTETAYRYACTKDDLARDWDFHVQDHTLELSEYEEKYKEAKAEDRFVCDLRHAMLPINIIVITDMFLPAYIGAINTMCRAPKQFDTRDKRIKLHVDLCNEVRHMVNGLSAASTNMYEYDTMQELF